MGVKLEFPLGGKIVASIPEYKSGWNIVVDKHGLINDKYSFLFFESMQADIWQQNEGWIVNRDDLEMFFKGNMLEYGFYGNEINDFIDYWIPLNDSDYYAIYPRKIKKMDTIIKLKFSKEPDNLLRLFYVIKGLDNKPSIELNKPAIESFKREGFFVVEWGVVTKDNLYF